VFACIKFAAEHGSLQAKALAVNIDIPGVDNWTKVQYIHDIVANTPKPSADQVKSIDVQLKHYCPTNLHEKYRYIEYLNNRKNYKFTSNSPLYRILSVCYYKLSKQPGTSPFMAQEYLKRAVENDKEYVAQQQAYDT